MAASVTVTSVDTALAPRIIVKWSDGSQSIYDNGAADVAAQTSELDSGITGEMTAKNMLMAYWRARSSNLSNTAIVVGKTLTYDLSNNNPIRIS